ncbi:MAG TPA: hypothetical protein VEM41_11255 [Actinomycetota bacterium]|nr:hypothetical protein [Actinomycetota bacterium]
MDEARYQQLMEKRDGTGLTDDEANELGRLMAEKEGLDYQGHGAKDFDQTSEEIREGERVAGAHDKEIDVDAERVNAVYEAQTGLIDEGGGTPGIQE